MKRPYQSVCFPRSYLGKNLLAVQETWVWSLGLEDPLEKEMATHSSTLAWKIAWTEEPSRLQFMVSQRVRHEWATSLHFRMGLVLFYKRLQRAPEPPATTSGKVCYREEGPHPTRLALWSQSSSLHNYKNKFLLLRRHLDCGISWKKLNQRHRHSLN